MSDIVTPRDPRLSLRPTSDTGNSAAAVSYLLQTGASNVHKKAIQSNSHRIRTASYQCDCSDAPPAPFCCRIVKYRGYRDTAASGQPPAFCLKGRRPFTAKGAKRRSDLPFEFIFTWLLLSGSWLLLTCGQKFD